MNAIISYPSIQ